MKVRQEKAKQIQDGNRFINKKKYWHFAVKKLQKSQTFRSKKNYFFNFYVLFLLLLFRTTEYPIVNSYPNSIRTYLHLWQPFHKQFHLAHRLCLVPLLKLGRNVSRLRKKVFFSISMTATVIAVTQYQDRLTQN